MQGNSLENDSRFRESINPEYLLGYIEFFT